MNKHLALMICCVFLGMTVLIGCDESPPPPPPKSKIIRKKIGKIPDKLLKKEVKTEDKVASQEVAPAEKTEKPAETLLAKTSDKGKSSSTEKTSDQNVAQKKIVPASEDKVKQKSKKTEQKPKSEGEEKSQAEDKKAIAALNVQDAGSEKNDPSALGETNVPLVLPDKNGNVLLANNAGGKIDPFVPLFRNEPEKKRKKIAPKGKKSNKPLRRLTPLEKLDLGQLKLVGIVRAENGNKALVEESSGKGYIITKGTYIGIHSGRVVEISKNKIVVEEKDEDEEGNPITHKRELKFQRPDGDDYYEM